MIGLVYADMQDPAMTRPFHLAACLSFELLATRHPAEIRALSDLSDGGVTGARLLDLAKASDFVFYWGHGDERSGAQVIYGSNERDFLPVIALGRLDDKPRWFYIDGCDALRGAEDACFPSSRVAGPATSVDFGLSVAMGSALTTRIVGTPTAPPKPFTQAFRSAVALLKRAGMLTREQRRYRLLGHGPDGVIQLSAYVRSDLFRCFRDLSRLDITRSGQ